MCCIWKGDHSRSRFTDSRRSSQPLGLGLMFTDSCCCPGSYHFTDVLQCSPQLLHVMSWWCETSFQFSSLLYTYITTHFTGIWTYVAKSFWPLVRTDGKYWRDSGCSLDWIPNRCQSTADASTRWTAGRLCPESLESLVSVPTTNTPQQKSHRVPKLSQLFSGLYRFSVFHSILCVLVSYLVEKQNCSIQSAGSGIIAGLRAGRSALQWQPRNHYWRQQTCYCVCVTVCVYFCRVSQLE